MSALKLDGAVAHKLWGGRFGGDSAPELDALNRSVDVDLRLWPFDVRLSKAWAVALWQAGVVSLEESRRLEQGLDAVAKRLQDGERPIPSDEDVHTLIDRLLHEEVGDVASKLHTGRSRNDQVATAARLWTIDAIGALDLSVRRLQTVMLEHARALHGERAIMPAYTHLQRAQPVEAAHWMLSHFWPLDRDRQRLAGAARAAAALPLGAGAVAGCAYPISRVLLQETLGFARRTPNSMDAVSDRDFVADLLYACAMLGVHLSRLAEDVILFGSAEFGFVQFGERYTTGSSMMPQKRNPDVFELARGAGSRILGDLATLLATLKGLPTGYNKDIQDDKRALFDATDTLQRVLAAVTGALAECGFRTDRMRAACSSTMMATDLADYLVAKGVSFRDAHGAVGRLVREAEGAGVELNALPLKSFTAAHPQFAADCFDALSPMASVERREVDGGTGPQAVAAQLDAAQSSLTAAPEPRGNALRILADAAV
ncbi:MAG TPA: argininosuccinate lyase [Gemmatimonadaceae bacterium]|nr:argininosuccinate lyase [Gemmatimonadaceae bacterium]